jgi:hypothetical protein
MATPTKKISKEVRYLNKDFAGFRDSLIEFSKIYFPNTYNDFNESSPGMMFIEMSSYIGDTLSYYIDSQFKESLLAFAEEKRTVFEMAQTFGYKPKLSSPAAVDLDVFQTVPSIGNPDSIAPDLRYGLEVPSGLEVKSKSGVTFRTLEDANFKYSSSMDDMETSIYETDADGLVSKYLLKKTVKAESGLVNTETVSIGSAEKYKRIILDKLNIIQIISITDSDSNSWYEVPFLAQDTVFDDVENTSAGDSELSQYSDDTPYLIKLIKTPRRYTTFIRYDNKTELRFGAGISDNPDEEIIPNPDSVGSSLPGSPSYLNTAFDPSNFLATKSYGQAPSNTTLTVTYSYGGGVKDNVAQGDLTQISSVSYNINDTNLNSNAVQDSKNSVAVLNPIAATGGRSEESIQEIKHNSLAYFQAQQRAVTKEDYIIRTYALPAKYGSISKVYIVQDDQLNKANDELLTFNKKKKKKYKAAARIANPLALNMYTLGYTADKKLITLNEATKENIKTYIGQYRMVTDAVNIKDAWVVNIGVKFNIITKRGYNKNDVLLKAIQNIKGFFDIDSWQINQPIILSDIAYKLSLVDGVASIVPPKDDNPQNLPILVTNKWRTSDGYSGNIYDIDSAIKDGVLYPSMDPSIFELKYPDIDIEGRVMGDY